MSLNVRDEGVAAGRAEGHGGEGHEVHRPEVKVNVIVVVGGVSRHVVFDKTTVTGAEIREKAGAQPGDDLVRREQGRPTGGNIAPSDTVEIKNGDHFVVLPRGEVS
jgi:hypothetical protein